MHKLSVGLIGGGIVALVFSITFGWLGFPHFINNLVKKNARLEKSSSTYKIWENPGESLNVYLRFYIFNVTNPNQTQHGAKPNVVEIGPYVYREKRKKECIEPGDVPGTLRYRERTYFYFEPSMSSGDESDLVTVVNLPFVAMASMTTALTDSEFVLEELDSQLNQHGEHLFRTESVRNLLFQGFSVQTYVAIITDPITQLAVGEIEVPRSFQGGKFAIYKGKNGSDSGLYEVYTGHDSSSDFARIVKWNNDTKLPWWPQGSECNYLGGTDGTIFPPFIQQHQILDSFTLDLCRTVKLSFLHKVAYDRVTGYRFSPLPEESSAPKPCFCPSGDPWDCQRKGLAQLWACREGAPVSLSNPHFFDGDPTMVAAISGLQPDEEKHRTFLDIEPTSGVVMRAAKRLQFNVDVVPVPAMVSYSKVRKLTFPILWAEEYMELPEDLMKQLVQLHHTQERIQTARWSLVGVSLVCLCLGIVWAATNKSRVGQAKIHEIQKY